MKKIGVLLCLVVFLLAIGCTDKNNDTVQIGIAIYKYEDNFMSFVKQAIEKYPQTHSIVNMNDSENNQLKQNEQVKTMIVKGIDALAINLVDIEQAQEIIRLAQQKKVPLVFFNREPSYDDLMSYDDCWYIGTNSKEAGIIQGDIISTSWIAHPEWDKNKDGILQYVLLQGEPGHPDAEMRSEYVVKTLENAGIPIEEVARETALWDSSKAKRVMDRWIEEYPNEIEYVICNNDSMALGAVASLQSKGYFSKTKFMPVVGVDAIPEILSKIEQGIVVGTVLNDASNQGKAIVEISNNIARGLQPTEGTSWIMDGTKAIRIPYLPITLETLEIAKESYE